MCLCVVIADVEQLANALATEVADFCANLPQDVVANVLPQSPTVASPPHVKQRVSEMSCFTSGPQGAADAAGVAVEVALLLLLSLRVLFKLLCLYLRFQMALLRLLV